MPADLDELDELERRYLITLRLTEALSDDELERELDTIATKIENNDAGGEDLYFEFEDRILEIYGRDADLVVFDFLDDETHRFAQVKRRLMLQYVLAHLDEEPESKQSLVEFAHRVKDTASRDTEGALEQADAELTEWEDIFIDAYYDDEDKDDDQDEDFEEEGYREEEEDDFY